MDMPKPTADHERLHRLAGIWGGSETMHPSPWDPKGGEAEGRSTNRVALGGFAVVTDYEQRRGGAVTFEGHGVYTWDDAMRQVVLHWFDSMNQGAEEFRGTWQGDVLTLQSTSPMGHARMTYDFSRPGTWSGGMEHSKDGATWTKLFDCRYTRQD